MAIYTPYLLIPAAIAARMLFQEEALSPEAETLPKENAIEVGGYKSHAWHPFFAPFGCAAFGVLCGRPQGHEAPAGTKADSLKFPFIHTFSHACRCLLM